MNLIFKSVKMNWWQISLFKLSMVSLGVVVGVWYVDFFANYLLILLLLFLIPAIYLVSVWLKQ